MRASRLVESSALEGAATESNGSPARSRRCLDWAGSSGFGNLDGFKQAPKQIKFIYENYYTNNQKDFIALLHFIKEKNNLSEIITLIKALEKKPFFEFSTEKLIFLSQQKPEAPARPAGNQAIIDKSLENLSDYANLLNKEKEKQIS